MRLRRMKLEVLSLVESSHTTLAEVEQPRPERMARPASLVVLGRTLAQSCRWDAAQGLSYSYYEVEIERRVRGSYDGHRVVVRQVGGKLGNAGQVVEGKPVCKPGERQLYFLVPGKHADVFECKGRFGVGDDADPDWVHMVDETVDDAEPSPLPELDDVLDLLVDDVL